MKTQVAWLNWKQLDKIRHLVNAWQPRSDARWCQEKHVVGAARLTARAPTQRWLVRARKSLPLREKVAGIYAHLTLPVCDVSHLRLHLSHLQTYVDAHVLSLSSSVWSCLPSAGERYNVCVCVCADTKKIKMLFYCRVSDPSVLQN